MFLTYKPDKILVEVLELPELWDPFITEILARAHAGEEMQDPEKYPKAALTFPSGEELPQAWVNPRYRANLPIPGYFPTVKMPETVTP